MLRSSLTQESKKGAGFLSLAFVVVWVSGCAYRFTNDHLRRPEGIKSIAVEAIYDTSREVLPHEILWESLQRAVVADGALRLAPQSSADAILRAHLKTASVSSQGSIVTNGPKDDPTIFDGSEPPPLSDFRRLSQAGEVRGYGNLATTVDIEVWSLRTQNMLLKRSYTMGQPFRAIHADSNVTTKANDFLRYDEAVEYKFKLLADDLARRVVQDLLVH